VTTFYNFSFILSMAPALDSRVRHSVCPRLHATAWSILLSLPDDQNWYLSIRKRGSTSRNLINSQVHVFSQNFMR